MNSLATSRTTGRLRMRRVRGITLLETLLSLGIMASIVTTIVYLTNESMNNTMAAATAQHLKTVGDAANLYIRAKFAKLTTQATDKKPVLILVSDLIDAKFLPAGFSATNPKNQATCVLVLQPSANKLNALVVTEGGNAVDDATLGQIAATVGGAGGGIYVTVTPAENPKDPDTITTEIRGSMHGWEIDPTIDPTNFAAAYYNVRSTCGGTAVTNPATVTQISLLGGHPVMALWYADVDPVSATLYRDPVANNPSLNTMNTPILMGTDAKQTPNADCTTPGAMARDESGNIIACVSTTYTNSASQTVTEKKWKFSTGFWETPVSYYNDAKKKPCNADHLGTVTFVTASSIRGVATQVPPPSTARGYVCGVSYPTDPKNPATTIATYSWQAIAVDDNGHMVIPATAFINTLKMQSSVKANSACTPESQSMSTGDYGTPLWCNEYTKKWEGIFGQAQRWVEGWPTKKPSPSTQIDYVKITMDKTYTNTTGSPIQFWIAGKFENPPLNQTAKAFTCTVISSDNIPVTFTIQYTQALAPFVLGPITVDASAGSFSCGGTASINSSYFYMYPLV